MRGPQHPAALLPLIDMSNHSFSPNCEVSNLCTQVCSISLIGAAEVARNNKGSDTQATIRDQ